MLMCNSSIYTTGMISSLNASICMINSSINSSIGDNCPSDTFRLITENTTFFMESSSIHGLYSTNRAINSTVAYANSTNSEPVSKNTTIPISIHSFGAGKAMVSAIMVRMNYSGNDPCHENEISLSVNNSTFLNYTLNSTGSVCTVRYNCLEAQIENRSWNLSYLSSNLKVSMRIFNHYGSNSTLWNLSIVMVSNDTFFSLGRSYFNYIFQSTDGIIYDSNLGLRDLQEYCKFQMINTERNALCLQNSSLFFMDNSIEVPGNVSPVQLEGNSSFSSLIEVNIYTCDFGTPVTNYSMDMEPSNLNPYENNVSRHILKELNALLSEEIGDGHNLFSILMEQQRILPQFQELSNRSCQLSDYSFEIDGVFYNRSIPLFPYFSTGSINETFNLNLPLIRMNDYHPCFYDGQNNSLNFSLSSYYIAGGAAKWKASVVQGQGVTHYSGSILLQRNSTVSVRLCFYSVMPGPVTINITIWFSNYTSSGREISRIIRSDVYRQVFLIYAMHFRRIHLRSTMVYISILNSGMDALNDSSINVTVIFNKTEVFRNESLDVLPHSQENLSFVVGTLSRISIIAVIHSGEHFLPPNLSRSVSFSIPRLALYNVSFILKGSTASPVYININGSLYEFHEDLVSLGLPNGSYCAVITGNRYYPYHISFNISGGNMTFEIALVLVRSPLNTFVYIMKNYVLVGSPFLLFLSLYLYNRRRNSVTICSVCSSTFKGSECQNCHSRRYDGTEKEKGNSG